MKKADFAKSVQNPLFVYILCKGESLQKGKIFQFVQEYLHRQRDTPLGIVDRLDI